jgi:DNA-binding GntR family transcriptional regulator
MVLSKIDKPEPLAKKAFKALRHSILTNELTTNVVYNEKSLARDLGISRTPVREALLELSSKRLVKFLPQKGVIINTFSNKDIDEVFEIRLALELFSIKKICLNYKMMDFSLLKKYLAEQKNTAELKQAVDFMEADRFFHIGFTKLIDNNYLMEMMQDIRDIMNLMRLRTLGIKGRMQKVVKEHENILKAVEKGEVVKAMEEMESHLEYSKNAVKIIHPE